MKNAAIYFMLVSGAALAQGLLDPTQPPAAIAPSAGPAGASGANESQEPVLQSVILSPGRKLAVINGRTYRAGERVGQAEIVTISTDHVTLREKGKTRTLALLPRDVRKSSASDAIPLKPGTSRAAPRKERQ